LSGWLRWQKGRQNTGYDKLLIAINPFVVPFDCFICADPIFQSARVNVFRSDVSLHSVSRVVGGARYVLSIGWVLPA
jgi:hypothetical protein